MAELSAAVGAGEPGGVCVDQQVVVEAVLPGEDSEALVALVWPEKRNVLRICKHTELSLLKQRMLPDLTRH